MTPITAKQSRNMKKSTNLNRDFLLKLELRSQPNLLCVIRGALAPLMESLGFSGEHSRAIIRAVDEAVSTEQGVEILLFDSGPAVDTTKLEARPLDEVRPGGLGLHIIRGSMDTVEYKRTGRLNQLRLVKYAKPSKGESGSAEENP
jgi:serine/threonine-protein kinase RsbW